MRPRLARRLPAALTGLVLLALAAAQPAAAQGRRTHPAPAAAAAPAALATHVDAFLPAASAGRNDVLVLDDGDDAPDDFFGFVDGSALFWANQFRLGSDGYRLEGFSFYLRTEDAARNTVYLAVRDASGTPLAEGAVEYDLAPDGAWFTATLDPAIDFAPGASFFLMVGNASGGVVFPAGVDAATVAAGAPTVAHVAESATGALEPVSTDFARDAFLIRAEGTLLRDDAPPAITHTPPAAPVPAGTALNVTAGIADDRSVVRATLVYEPGGGPTRTVAMAPGGGAYAAAIPADALTSRGLRYRIEAEDDAGHVSRTPWRSPRVRVGGDGVTGAFSWSSDRYRLVSIPLALDAAGADAVLADDLGAYDVERWRLYGLDASQAYREHPSAGALQPGRAFWLALRDAAPSFDTGAGTAAPLDAPFEIALHAGWNFVGTPFHFDVPLANVRLASGAALDIRRFDDDWRTHVGPLRPFEGYAVFVPSADRLLVDPAAGSSAAAPEAPEALDWALRVVAETSGGRDADNLAGVARGGLDGWDDADLAEAPSVGPRPVAYFLAPEAAGVAARLGHDVRAPGTVEGWTLHVEARAGETVHLAVPDVAALPDGISAWLTDTETGRRVDLRTVPRYTYTAGTDAPRVFRLAVGPAVDADLPAALAPTLALYPAPVHDAATVEVHLPEAGPVRLVVHDLLGREVARLVDGPLPEGRHAARLDARGLPSGAYVLHLTAAGDRATRSFVVVR